VSEDLREGLDGLQSDMAGHQARFRGEVSGEANRSLAVSTIERLDRELADQEGRLQPNLPEVVAPAPIERSVEKREVDGAKYVITKEPDAPMFRSATEFESQVMQHAWPRLQLLLAERDTGPLGQPSWHDRTKAAMFFKVKSIEALTAGMFDLADNYERAYQLDIQELLDASSQPFGDWRADAPKKLILT
jgi:hypothetical protein